MLAIRATSQAFSSAYDAGWRDKIHKVGELSLKHLHIWTSVLHSGAVGAIVFEDDFVASSDSCHSLMTDLLVEYAGNVDFIDLAGGFSREAIGLSPKPEEDLNLDFIASNTTCAYFISRKACEALFDLLHSDPAAKYFGADWLLNAVNEKLQGAKSVHPWKLPYIHGSLTGGMPSLFG